MVLPRKYFFLKIQQIPNLIDLWIDIIQNYVITTFLATLFDKNVQYNYTIILFTFKHVNTYFKFIKYEFNISYQR